MFAGKLDVFLFMNQERDVLIWNLKFKSLLFKLEKNQITSPTHEQIYVLITQAHPTL